MIEQLVSFVIRPPRAEYSVDTDLLGPHFTIKGRRYQRTDLQLVNRLGQKLECSHYEPHQVTAGEALPCVIYCHGNSGCRADANEAAVLLLPDNITVFAIDFSGSGKSDGEFVTLGKFEMEDLAAAVDHLRVEGRTSRIALWGRSMGAVTALLYGATDPSIAGMVLDSPFTNLQLLILELVEFYRIRLPRFTVKLAVQYMRRLIRQRAHFDISELDTLVAARTCFIPALFTHGNEDSFIRPHHSEDICEVYAGEKNLVKFEGDHNSQRPPFFYDSSAIFFHNVLLPPPSSKVSADEASDSTSNFEDDSDLELDDVDQDLLFRLMASSRVDKPLREQNGEPATMQPLVTGEAAEPSDSLKANGEQNGHERLLSSWQMSSTVVPVEKGEETEAEEADELTRMLMQPSSPPGLQSAAEEPFPVAPESTTEVESWLLPVSSDDEERMLMEAIALSLQDQSLSP